MKEEERKGKGKIMEVKGRLGMGGNGMKIWNKVKEGEKRREEETKRGKGHSLYLFINQSVYLLFLFIIYFNLLVSVHVHPSTYLSVHLC